MSWVKLRKQRNLVKRVQTLILVTTLTVGSIQTSMNVSAGNSFTGEMTDAISSVLDAMDKKGEYDNAVDELNSSLDSLEGAASVTGLMVTDTQEDSVTIEWDPFEAENLVGYNVYWADKNTKTQVFMKLTKDGTKTIDDKLITVGPETTNFTYHKSTHVNHYFKVSPVFNTGEGSRSGIVKTQTAKEYRAYLENLDRGLMKVATTEGVFLSWRLLGTEVDGYGETGLTGTNFNVYEGENLLATISDSTNNGLW